MINNTSSAAEKGLVYETSLTLPINDMKIQICNIQNYTLTANYFNKVLFQHIANLELAIYTLQLYSVLYSSCIYQLQLSLSVIPVPLS